MAIQTASSSWKAIYICLTLDYLRLLEFRETPYTLKNTDKPSKWLVIKSLVVSTSFVSESAKLAQV